MSKVNFNMILAATKKFGIGKDGNIPWHLPKEYKHFQQVTTNSKIKKQNIVVMGRKTYESLPDNYRPLKNRINVVISSKKINDENVYQARNFEESLKLIESEFDLNQKVFICGGQRIYEEAADHENCQRIYLTRIGQNFDCDTFVSKDILKNFKLKQTYMAQSENNINYDFQVYHNQNFNNDDKTLKYKANQEQQYLNLIEQIIQEGNDKSDRTGTGTKSLFGGMMRYDLSQTFPLLTTKDVFWRGVAEELIWFIKGQTNGNILLDKKIKIWEGNGSREFLDNLNLQHREVNDLGPIYGFQWRHFGAKYTDMHANYENQGYIFQFKGVDQLKNLINDLKNNPDSRRHIISAWNPVDIPIMALPPCHVFSQFYINDNKLSCILYQRSCDMGLGIPFNIASYSLLTCILANHLGLERGEFIHMMGDMHVYNNHIEALEQQIKRVPNPFPCLEIKQKHQNIEDYTMKDFILHGYDSQGKIKMKMAV